MLINTTLANLIEVGQTITGFYNQSDPLTRLLFLVFILFLEGMPRNSMFT